MSKLPLRSDWTKYVSALSTFTDTKTLTRIYQQTDEDLIKKAVLLNPNTDSQIIHDAVQSRTAPHYVISNPALTPNHLDSLLQSFLISDLYKTLPPLTRNPNTSADVLRRVHEIAITYEVDHHVLAHPNTPMDILWKIVDNVNDYPRVKISNTYGPAATEISNREFLDEYVEQEVLAKSNTNLGLSLLYNPTLSPGALASIYDLFRNGSRPVEASRYRNALVVHPAVSEAMLDDMFDLFPGEVSVQMELLNTCHGPDGFRMKHLYDNKNIFQQAILTNPNIGPMVQNEALYNLAPQNNIAYGYLMVNPKLRTTWGAWDTEDAEAAEALLSRAFSKFMRPLMSNVGIHTGTLNQIRTVQGRPVNRFLQNCITPEHRNLTYNIWASMHEEAVQDRVVDYDFYGSPADFILFEDRLLLGA